MSSPYITIGHKWYFKNNIYILYLIDNAKILAKQVNTRMKNITIQMSVPTGWNSLVYMNNVLIKNFEEIKLYFETNN